MKTKDKVLILINEFPGIELWQLCNLAHLNKSNIFFHVKTLEEKELIERIEIGNKKNLKIHPTKKGKDLYLKLKFESLIKANTKS